MRAVISKRGVDKKGGGFLQPAQESYSYYNPKKAKNKKRIRISFFHDVANFRHEAFFFRGIQNTVF
jgi:hypothetical protein